MELFASAVSLIGIIAFIVAVITQLTKGIGFLAKIPTVIQVIVLALVTSCTYYFVQCAVDGTPILWYEIVKALVIGIIAAFVATYGWDSLNELWKRFKK